jgi:peptidoglycan/LPS O-acetylase OafA/YrhL
LDALRGIAALAVALHHLARAYGAEGPPLLPSTAVDLFFILSGFVMTRTYESRMRDGLNTRKFLALRYKRLFLPLAIGSTFGVLWTLWKYGPSIDLIVSYVLILGFLPAVWMANCFSLNGPAWSLFEEISANALHGILFAKLRIRALAALWGASASMFLILFFSGNSHWAPDLVHILSLFPRELSCYLMGILIYRLRGDEPFGNRPLAAVLLFPAVLYVATLHPVLEVTCTLVAAPLVMRAALAMKQSIWAALAGAMSYPLYATHQPLIGLAVLAGLRPASASIAALVVGSAVTSTVEMKRKSSRRKSREVDVSRMASNEAG